MANIWPSKTDRVVIKNTRYFISGSSISIFYCPFQLFKLTSHLIFALNHLTLKLNNSYSILGKNWKARVKVLYFCSVDSCQKCGCVWIAGFARLMLTCPWIFGYKKIHTVSIVEYWQILIITLTEFLKMGIGVTSRKFAKSNSDVPRYNSESNSGDT